MVSMEVSVRNWLCFFMLVVGILVESAATSSESVSAAAICQPFALETILLNLKSQCPLSIPVYSSPIEVDAETFVKAITSSQKNGYTACLLYASWCPFSSIFMSKFSTLSAMYPQIKHLTLEESLATPSVFSRCGIHSAPLLQIVNRTMQIRYHGRKDLESLVNFYRRATGLDPVVNIVEEASSNLVESSEKIYHLQDGASLKKKLSQEPYLLLSVVFVFSRIFLYFFPDIASSCITALCVAYYQHLNMGRILGEARPLIGHVLYLVDVRRIWNKLKLLCKTKNVQEGARNAGVWASSLAAVSLGKAASSSRFFPS